MKKSIFAALALLALTGCATRLPEDELRLTRERLDKYLFNEGNLTQSEMTILSTYLLRLARMEQYMIKYRIWNQPGYEKIEKQFMADCKRWDKKLEEESKKPSAYAGGTMESCDRNLKMVHFIQKRIDKLKNQWEINQK